MSAQTVADEISEALELLARRKDLGRNLTSSILGRIMEGEVGEAQTAAFLMGLRTKGETAEELHGLAETMRSRAEKVEVTGVEGLLDTCGTGGDRRGTFNISTTAAFVVAGAGVPVAKHGNRAATSRCGSADVLEALGVRIELSPGEVARCIRQVGIGFMFAPLHHRAMKHLMPVRRGLGIRTVINLLGPLTNPAGAKRQLIGVSSADYLEPVGGALAALGAERALLVHGEDGLDELTVTGNTSLVEVAEGKAGSAFSVAPEHFGLGRWPAASLAGGEPADNAAIALSVLQGDRGAAMDVVLLNAGAALYVAGAASSLQGGVEQARESIESGRAREKVDALVQASNAASPAGGCGRRSNGVSR
jgi:anthranilate phosphoribosyltransferase